MRRARRLAPAAPSAESLLAPMGAWLHRLRFSDIPEPARRAARFQVLDLVAACHAGARSPETLAMLAGLPAGKGPSTVLATGERTAPQNAAFANAVFSMAQDFDDILWIGHTGHSAVFAALAVAEAEGRSGEELLAAVVAADEVAGRLGASAFFGPLNGQMATFVHLAGAAAAAASLLGLDAERATHALAIALSQPPLALQPAFFASTSKLLAAAVPTQIGVQAAYLAKAGMTGASRILEDPKGFYRSFSFLPMPELLSGLGATWAIQSLTIKTFPTCHYFQTACTALERLCSRRWPNSPADVDRIVIHTTKLGAEVTRLARESAGGGAPLLSPAGVGFDLALAAAVLLDARKLTGDECRAEVLRERATSIRRWYPRIEIAHDPALTLQVLDSAWQLEAGREALRSLGPRAIARLALAFRRHYGSALVSGREASAWARAVAGRLRGRGAQAAPPGEFTPLWFPNRVEIRYATGAIAQCQVDLPVGSLASPSMPAALEEKFRREVGARLGAERAGAALAAVLSSAGATAADLAAAAAPARSAESQRP